MARRPLTDEHLADAMCKIDGMFNYTDEMNVVLVLIAVPLEEGATVKVIGNGPTPPEIHELLRDLASESDTRPPTSTRHVLRREKKPGQG